jgi:hypothetical protein
MEQLTEPCDLCGHDWNPHVLVATMYSAEHGGLILCDQLGCDCESTWSIEGREGPYIPSPDEVQDLRLLVQTGQLQECEEDDPGWYGDAEVDSGE